MEQTHNTDDLHDLVTLEPSLRDYVHLPAPSISSPSSNGNEHQSNHSRRLSSPLFSSFSPQSPDPEQGPSHAHSRPASMSQRRSTRWPFLTLSSRNSGSSSRNSASFEPLASFADHNVGLHPPTVPTSNSHDTAMSPSTIVLNAQKDSDDVDDSYDVGKRRSAARRNTSTSARVNRLFTMQSSPGPSREPSYQKQPTNFSYKRCM